ncbi:MAG: phage integrase N-terminal SAM-like domain-containing protein [Verrucomicrobiota bacterium]
MVTKLSSERDKQWNRPRRNEPSSKWQHQLIRLIRVRQYQWQTEKTYVHWLKRLATFHQRTDLENLDNAQIAGD